MAMRGMKQPGHWIPYSFFGFFAVIFLANGIMLYFALGTWTGLTTESAFQDGLAYNDRLAERERQRALGWQVSFQAVPDGPGHVVFDLQIDDERGVPVTAADVAVSLTRPTHEGHDFTAELSHRGGGRYAGEADLPLPGQWQLDLVIDEPRGPYRLSERLVAP